MTKAVTYLLVVPEELTKELIKEALGVFDVPFGVMDYDFEGTHDAIKRVYDSGQELARLIEARVDSTEKLGELMRSMEPMLKELKKRLKDEGLLE